MKAIPQEPNPDCNMQLTQYLPLNSTMSVPGSSCKPPYRCSQCTNRRQDRVADPEKKGQAYKTNGCDRPDKTMEISVKDWLQETTKRINSVKGRIAEICEENEGTGSAAIFANRLAAATGHQGGA